MLHINNLRFGYGGRTLLDNATVAIPSGHKIGLIGRNGCGKSTLFALIAGEIAPDDGEIRLRARARMGRVAQEAPDGDIRLLDVVLAADDELSRLTQRLETEDDPGELAELHARLEDIGARSAESRAAAILSGLGFSAEAILRPVGELSGGWRMRVALAATLFTKPDLLLLDEPTNYLDLEGVIWLKSYLKTYPYTLLLISHDRDLLNAVPTGIIHVEHGRLNSYRGNYDRFERTRAEALTRHAKSHSAQEAQRRRLQAFVDRFRAKASKASQAQSRLKMLEKLVIAEPLVDEARVDFDFPVPERLSPPLLSFDDVALGYGGEPVLRGLNLRIDPDDRIALLGVNGAGKSTFAKALAGLLKPMAGDVAKSRKMLVGHFAQHQLDALKPEQNPYQHMAALMPMAPVERIRGALARFGIGADHVERPVTSLSGGEKARLLLALISRDKPALLILDEPTNHLDIDARQALLDALNAYEGAVLLISHDWHLVSACAERLWVVTDGTIRTFEGDLDDYARSILAERRTAKTARIEGKPETRSPRDLRRDAAQKREKLKPLRREVEKLEKEIEKATADKAELAAMLADPALYDDPSDAAVARISQLQRDIARLAGALESLEGRWMAAHDALESAANNE